MIIVSIFRSLHGNPIGDAGVESLVDDMMETIRERKGIDMNLRELDLGDTRMGDQGITKVARLLVNNTSLKTLNLNSNPAITLDGWKKLAKGLSRNMGLENLSLDFNNIGDGGIVNLAAGLKHNTTLKTLELEDTGLTKKGAIQLLALVKANTTLRDITFVPGNDIPAAYREEIRKYLNLNKEAAANPYRHM